MSAAKFTVEQIELIRRLRETGITRPEIMVVLDELDRLDKELGKIKTKSSPDAKPSSLSEKESPDYKRARSCSTSSDSIFSDFGLQIHGTNSIKSKELSIIPIKFTSSQESGKTTLTLSQNSTNSQSGTKNHVQTPIINNESKELEEFKKKGEHEMMMEIKNFVLKYNIRQNMIAEMTRISQGYISRFFRGEGQDMSEKVKNMIYIWYLQCKSNPAKILYSCPNTVGDKKMITETGDILPIRRDRFIFRRQHLEILEKYFLQNPYPDAHMKEQIAEECNTAVERISTRTLPERDKVTVATVSNWFNNKRKDSKNRTRPSGRRSERSYSNGDTSNHELKFDSGLNYKDSRKHNQGDNYSNFYEGFGFDENSFGYEDGDFEEDDDLPSISSDDNDVEEINMNEYVSTQLSSQESNNSGSYIIKSESRK